MTAPGEDSPTEQPPPAGPPRRLRGTLAALAVMLPMIPVVIGLTLTSGGGQARARPAGTSAASTHYVPITPMPKLATPNLLLPPGTGALVAVVERATTMRSRPGGRVIAHVATQTSFGSPDGMWVRRLSGGWLGVVSTQAGNNRIGWIPAADASLVRVDWKLEVSLGARRLTVLENGRPVERYTIAIGAPGTPTPTGAFAVTDRLKTGDPAGPYGCCILALSATAPHAIADWNGGDRVAIHSTPETWTIGQAVSHGCMRLTLAEGRWLLDHIPIGTPTIIRS